MKANGPTVLILSGRNIDMSLHRRIVCGDPNSVMPAWLQPKGPLNYKEVEDIISFITASKDTKFTYQPQHVLPPETIPPPVDEEGWRDPSYSPPPDATPVPACWRAPAASQGPATPAPVTSPGTADNPRVIEIHATANLTWVDANGTQLSQIAVVPGETIDFKVTNDAGFDHNFHIGGATELSSAPPTTQEFIWTVDSLPDQPQFACTISGHYQSGMHGDFVVQQADGGSGSPAPSAGATPATSPVASPQPSQSAAP